jgi:hypothetical protein
MDHHDTAPEVSTSRRWIGILAIFLIAVGTPVMATAQEKPHVEESRPPVESVNGGVAPTTSTMSIVDSVSSVSVSAAPPVEPPLLVAKPYVARAAVVARGSGKGGDGPRLASIYVFVACWRADDPSDKCRKGVAEATEALTDSMAEEVAESGSKRMIKVKFTAFLDRAEQLKALKEMEYSAIHTMEFMLNQQLAAASPFIQPLPVAVAWTAILHDERALEQINVLARSEAVRGSNWTHDWPISTHTYTSNVYNEPESWHLSPALKHEYECAGAGNKPGCNWDGRKDQTLYTK